MANQNLRQEPADVSALAALYAIDALDEVERDHSERCLNDSPSFANQVAEFKAVVASLCYSAPPAPMAADLKHRLFERITDISATEHITQGTVTAIPPSPSHSSAPLIDRATEAIWEPHPVPGVTIRKLYVDEYQRQITCVIRMEAGVEYPLHRHVGVEEAFMLEGDLIVAGEVCHQGDYIRSEINSAHAPVTHGGCTVLVRTCLDDEFLIARP